MRCFFVDRIRSSDGSCSIKGPEAKHIFNVLRMEPGEQFILMDQQGTRFLALIESACTQEIRVSLEKPLPKPSPSSVNITLCQSLLKSRQMDYMIQKTSELGVDSIIPFLSKRTVVRLDKDRYANKMRHWNEIARNSAKQSGRSVPAEIVPVFTFEKLMQKWKSEDLLKVILWEEEGSRDLKSLLKESKSVSTVVGMVGPEGGFTKQEIEASRDAGFISASLGKRTLRAETAAITLVGIIQYECGDLSLITS